MDEKLNSKDKVLLMRDEREGDKLKVVKGIDKKGKIDAIGQQKPTENQEQQKKQVKKKSTGHKM